MRDSGSALRGEGTVWVLYDDAQARRLRPLTWLRPASGLQLGAWTGRQRLERVSGNTVLEVCRDTLVPLAPGRFRWSEARPLSRTHDGSGAGAAASSTLWDGSAVWVSSRVLADVRVVAALRELPVDTLAVFDGRPIAFRPGVRMASWVLAQAQAEEDGSAPNGSRGPGEGKDFTVLDPAARILEGLLEGDWPARETGARILRGLADLVRFQEELLGEDLQDLLVESPAPGSAGDGRIYGAEAVRLGQGCVIDHGAVIDAREGPVVLGPGCHVFPHTWIQGPLVAGESCLFLGGRIGGGTSLGPVCRVRGEVEASVLLGCDNKAHDGFLGHSYLGEWINLGAMTTNSDLKNNYSDFTIEPYGETERTGLRKVGVFLGDHVKTRIGCLLGGGAVAGVGANLIGDPAVSARWIPDFLWGSGPGGQAYAIDRFLETARIVYGRRKIPWTEAAEEVLREVFTATREAREAFLKG